MKKKNRKNIFKIKTYGNENLKKKANVVINIDNKLKKIVKKMAFTMYKKDGIGLASNQVDRLERVFIVDISKNKNNLIVFINPKLSNFAGESIYNEGCLSIPNIHYNIKRPKKVTITAYNLKGEKFMINADGLLARVIQHENDHLNGKLFIENLNSLEYLEIKKRLDKFR